MLIRQEIGKTQEETTTYNNNIDKNEILYRNFINALKSKTTKEDYTRRLKYFLEFLGYPDGQYSAMVDPNKDKKMIESDIKSFLVFLREKKRLSYLSATQYLNALKKFYYVNSDFEFKWPLIKMYLGNDDDDVEDEDEEVEEDRPYTREEIKIMLKTATDPRVKIIILLMSSSGMRHGAIPLLRLKDLTKIKKYNLYQITVYQKSKKYNYKTFCTPECAAVIDSYLNYRKHAGEILKDSSPLLREQFNSLDKFKVNNPKPIGVSLVRYLVNEVLIKYSALRQKIPYDYQNKRREQKNPTMLTHSLRKFFDTEARKAGVYPDFVELLMGHKLPGVRSHYFKPDPIVLLEGTNDCKGYRHAINDLTIDESNRLQKQVQELKEQDDYQKYVIDKKMKEKDDQIKALQDSIKFLSDTVNRALLAGESVNKIITATTGSDSGKRIVKGIELKQEIKNKAVGKVIPSSSNSNNKKK
jgi:integrase